MDIEFASVEAFRIALLDRTGHVLNNAQASAYLLETTLPFDPGMTSMIDSDLKRFGHVPNTKYQRPEFIKFYVAMTGSNALANAAADAIESRLALR